MEFSDAFWLRLRSQGIAPIPGYTPPIYTFSEELFYEPELPDDLAGSPKKHGNTDHQEFENALEDNFDEEEGEFAALKSQIKSDDWSGQLKSLRNQLALERSELLKKLAELHAQQMRQYTQDLMLARRQKQMPGSATVAMTLNSGLTGSAPVRPLRPPTFDRQRIEQFMFLSGSMLSNYDSIQRDIALTGANRLSTAERVPFLQASPPAGLAQTQSLHVTARKSISEREKREKLRITHAKQLSRKAGQTQDTLHSPTATHLDSLQQEQQPDLSASQTVYQASKPVNEWGPSLNIKSTKSFIEQYFTDLNLRYCNIAHIDHGISGFTRLQQLDISHNQLTHLDLSILPASLQVLKVHHNAIRDSPVDYDADTEPNSFDALDWSGVTNLIKTSRRQDPEQERPTQSRAPIAFLSIGYNQLRSLKSFLPLAETLMYLDVSYNRLEDVDECLMCLKAFKRLRYLYISGNPVCTDKLFVARLRDALDPNCSILAQPAPRSPQQSFGDSGLPSVEAKSLAEMDTNPLAKYDSLPDLDVDVESLDDGSISVGTGKTGQVLSQSLAAIQHAESQNGESLQTSGNKFSRSSNPNRLSNAMNANSGASVSSSSFRTPQKKR